MARLQPEELKKNPLFEYLTVDEITRVIGLGERRQYDVDDLVFQQNDEAKYLYIVEDGLVGMIVQLRPGNQLTVATEAEGGAFGWAALLPPNRHSAAAKCFQPSEIIALSGEKLRELCYRDLNMGVRFMEGLARFIVERLNNTNLVMLEAMWK